ncbi:MAG: hypothetical protein EOO43_18400, partial [Flavobacterium sp.]
MSNVILETSVSSIDQLNNFIQNDILGNVSLAGVSKHFRGQADSKYLLQTRIAALYGDSYTVQLNANRVFNCFIDKLKDAKLHNEIFVADMNQGLYEKVYYIIFQLQHLGVPTPFMD